jgi:L,D-transpeptidase catalytic domain
MNKIWYSRQWDNAPMPHAVFFTKDGHAIHGTYEIKRLGKPASHGCVRLSPGECRIALCAGREDRLEEHAGGISRQHAGRRRKSGK